MRPFRETVRRPWFRRTALAVALPLPLFLTAANVMLWTGAVEAIVTRDDGSVTLTHGFAWVLWPTRVHLHDAHLELDGDGYQLDVRLEDAVVDIRLLSLFERRAELQSIDANGVRAQYRRKLEAEDADHPAVAAYPPIDGEPRPPRPRTPEPPAGEAWTVDLDDVRAQVDALWIDEFAFEPGGLVHGGLHWTDGGAFSVPPTTVRPAEATLWLGPHAAVRSLVGDGTLSIASVDLGAAEPGALTAALSFDYRGEGVLADPRGLATWWPQLADIVAGEPGPIALDVAAEDGVLVPGSRAHHHTARADLGPATSMLRGEADLVLAIEADGRPSATVTLTQARLVGGDVTMATTAAIRGFLFVTHGDLTRPWALDRVHAETDAVIAEDLRRFSRLAPPESWSFTRGSAEGHARLDIAADEIPILHVDAALDEAVFTVGSVHIGATLQTRGRVRYESGELVADGLTARTDALSLRTARGKSDGTWVRVRDTTLRYAGGELRVDSHATIEDARPAIVHLTRLDPIIDAVPDLRRIQPIAVHAKMRVRDESLELEIVDAEQLGLHVATLWNMRGDDWRLAVLASGLTAFGYTMAAEQKLGRPFVLVGESWYAEQCRWVRALGVRRQG